ncbi:M14 family zinc carboxypeptidase [Zeaxanthinibacter enoshimensis]|uniref:Zinc carboxypeptidase n=1 Tax=Zeaxanthinibacter enoshimensis TaxID=392009 RepID=A0A4R6TKF5_9FLAO|nr:M14 family zinc carboxypeptidase [Zeaxanthinibacter enoshimensis]TDQ31404.1 zinc carboxypeptidase [Zeaxanthinibacter enoshimensis]
MLKRLLALQALLFFSCASEAQTINITDTLYATYGNYQESSIRKRRIKHQDIQPLIDQYRGKEGYEITKVGTSIEGRPLHLISLGNGSTDVFLWSQMHGDEPTATQAIFDILNFFDSKDFSGEKKAMLDELRIHFLPMLNPDGAEVFQRRNTLGIDINRDALRLQSPEGRTLKRVRDSLEADFGFNLHDQSIYYNAERTPKPATISYLAPAFNYEKDINQVRADAMRVIVFMNDIIQKYAPGQVGRYNDDFEPRAFGDNIQKWGTSTILIESGGFPGDTEKQEIRKLNYVSILSAIYTIATGQYKDIPIEAYENIPENDRKLFDLKLEGLSYNLLGNEYTLDLGIQRTEIDNSAHSDFWNRSTIADQGDLSTFYGYQVLDASGYTAVPGKIYPKTLNSLEAIKGLDLLQVLKDGYLYVRVADLAKSNKFVQYPINVLSTNYKIPEFRLTVDSNPNFLLQKNGINEYAVVNGFLIPLQGQQKDFRFKNALILR